MRSIRPEGYPQVSQVPKIGHKEKNQISPLLLRKRGAISENSTRHECIHFISGDKHLLKVTGYRSIKVLTPRKFVDAVIKTKK